MSQNLIGIEDGYTRDGYLAGSDGRYEAIRFTYRPMLPNEVTQYERKCSNDTKGDTGDMGAAIVTKHLRSWSEVDDAEKPVPLEFNNVRRLHPFLLIAVENIIKGYIPSDRDPDKSTDKETEDAVASILGESPHGQRLTEEQGKN